MKKSLLMIALLGSAVVLWANEPATFENAEGGIQATETEAWLGAQTPVSGVNEWTSGDYTFYTYQDDSWGVAYYYAFTVSADKANTSMGYMEPYRSASGGAYAGENFAVWSSDYYGSNSVKCAAHVVPGFFVNNNAYTVTAMRDGLAPARAFTAEDNLVLTCQGKLKGEEGEKVEVELAANGKYIAAWTYVSLEALGEVDEIVFSMHGTDTGDYGLNTPAYFCIDNFGASMPEGYTAPEMASFPITALESAVSAPAAVKVVLNGETLVRMADGRVYNMMGMQVR